MTRLDQNRAKFQAATKMGVSVNELKGVHIWGNHSKTQVPDLTHATLPNGDIVADNVALSWITNYFIPTVQNRGAAVIEARGFSSALSAAKAAADHVRALFLGSDEEISMGVFANGQYGVNDVFYSFPVKCTGEGNYSIIEDLSISDDLRLLLDKTRDELVDEKNEAIGILNEQQSS